jgi:hypothetical protein
LQFSAQTHNVSNTCYPTSNQSSHSNQSSQTVGLQSSKPVVPQPTGTRPKGAASDSRTWIGDPKFKSTVDLSAMNNLC